MHNNKLILGQIGVGYWGPNLARNFLACKGVHKLIVCDTNLDMLNKAIGQFPQIEITQNVDEIFNNKEIDAVIIALPAFLHFEYAKRALLAGKHVFVEKPLSKTSREAIELIDIAQNNNKIIMVGHTFLFNSAVRKVKEYIDAGELGDIYYIFSQRLNLGQVRQDVNALWNLAPHDISIILYWLGEEPSFVTAKGVSFLQPGIEDLVFTHLDFPSGKSAHIHVSWLDPSKTRKMVVVGSKKMIVYDDVSADARIIIYDKGIDKTLKNNLKFEIMDYAAFNLKNRMGDVIIPYVNFDEPLKAETRHFVECVLSNKEPLTNGQNGLQVVKILEQAQQVLEKSRNYV